jgi:hypothetical protein
MNTENSTTNETDNSQVETSLPDVSFEYKDDTAVNDEIAVTEEYSSYKYTKIDCLDEDAPIHNQKYVLLSFISPEGLMNCKVKGLKVRGIYATEGEAKAACDKLKKKDKYFDVFVGEVGKWLPWDPSIKQVEEVKYDNKKLDKIMSKLHEKETKSLNELVGRRKEMLDKETTSHKNRIRNSIKESVDTYEDTNDEPVPEDTGPKIVKKQHNSSVVKQRLQKALENRKNKETKSVNNNFGEQRNQIIKDLDEKKKKLNEETHRVIEKTENVDELKKKATVLDNTLKKMKEQFEQKKKSALATQ